MSNPNSFRSNKNKFIVTIARMNPVHPGHMRVIKKLIEVAVEEQVNDVYVILSQTIDENNPLYCEYKKNILQLMIEKTDQIKSVNVNIICSKNPYMSINPIVDKLFPKPLRADIIIVVGDDREGSGNSIQKFYKRGMVTEILLSRSESSARQSKLSSRESTLSATQIRQLVTSSDYPKFHSIYEEHLDGPEIQELYKSLQSGLNIEILDENVNTPKNTPRNTSKNTPKNTPINTPRNTSKNTPKKKAQSTKKIRGGATRKRTKSKKRY